MHTQQSNPFSSLTRRTNQENDACNCGERTDIYASLLTSALMMSSTGQLLIQLCSPRYSTPHSAYPKPDGACWMAICYSRTGPRAHLCLSVCLSDCLPPARRTIGKQNIPLTGDLFPVSMRRVFISQTEKLRHQSQTGTVKD